MRIVGLPEFSGAVVRPGTGTPAPEKVAPTQKVATDTSKAAPPMSTSRISAGQQPPVQSERVREIRRAIETNTYPLIPVKIADGIIAAGLYGKIGK